MGNNRLYLKMLLSSIILLFTVYMIINIYNYDGRVVSLLFGTSALYVFVSTVLWRLASVYQEIFYDYDKKYFLRYDQKLVLSKNDKYILKHIVYTVHDRRKHRSFLETFKTKNTSEIDNYLSRNNYEINDRETFDNVITLVSEYLSNN